MAGAAGAAGEDSAVAGSVERERREREAAGIQKSYHWKNVLTSPDGSTIFPLER
jgi:hypothetical protein